VIVIGHCYRSSCGSNFTPFFYTFGRHKVVGVADNGLVIALQYIISSICYFRQNYCHAMIFFFEAGHNAVYLKFNR
jgi:hypothetical protein